MQPSQSSAPLFESRLKSLKKIHQGKVRDIYDVDADHLLIVTTDRLSAFDVVLPDPIPRKGEVLTRISLFWFARTRQLPLSCRLRCGSSPPRCSSRGCCGGSAARRSRWDG